jgi:hypothetical protein
MAAQYDHHLAKRLAREYVIRGFERHGFDFECHPAQLQVGSKSRAGLGNEMFNAPNHVELNAGGQLTWANGSNPAPSANFGRMTSTFNRMRQIQFALKFTF